MKSQIRVTRLLLCLSLFPCVTPGFAGQAQTPQDSEEARDFKIFTDRVQAYVKMQKNLEASLPALKPTKDAARDCRTPARAGQENCRRATRRTSG